MDKTKVMSNVNVRPTPVLDGGSVLEVVDEYIYLGQTVRLGRSNFEKEVNRRIQLGSSRFIIIIISATESAAEHRPLP